ncbi:nuclear transport factor 2 family protein [Algihabitans albus]|uniref:nuclear transport factor 2 family protein n=1 Tax=Algihabitans albus TaxID=2164067 RepID=UPI000E5C78CB|nr:nuclear transport factor 2 family protein [Algihabitans albus]
MTREEALRRYAKVFEDLTPDTLDDLGALVGDDVRFVDPFNELRGREAFLGVFREMFDRLQEPGFTVSDVALGQEAGYLRWRMTFRTKSGGRAWQIDGMSELRFGADDRVSQHLDHWDAGGQFYAKLPLLGWLIGQVRRRLSHER